MDDDRARVFDVPDAPARPAPAPQRQSVPVQETPAAPDTSVSAADGLWDKLLDRYKGRLPVNFRVMLNMARGALVGDVLHITCRDDFTLRQLDCATVAAVLEEVTAGEVGHPIRLQFRVGKLDETRPAVPVRTNPKPVQPERTPPPPPEPPPQEAPPPIEDRPPWEKPPAQSHDKLDELLQNGRQLDNFQIR